MEGHITMTLKEISRFKEINLVIERKRKQSQAAKNLGLSVRHVKRLCKNLKTFGPKGLISKKRGSKGNYCISEILKERASSIIEEKYPNFGPTLAHEKLIENHGLKISLSTIRNLMIGKEIWIPKAIKRKVIHQMRERRHKLGELVQIDGSPDDWFEDRDSKCTLLVFIDDATSFVGKALFVKSETTFNYMEITKSYINEYGRPLAFYSDKHSVFKVYREKSLSGANMTQYGRALQELDIKLICANSPQAKGRVERVNRTLQDRLKKELRLQKISTMEEANSFLPLFLKDFNKKFAKVAINSNNAHRILPQEMNLENIFNIKNKRILSKNLTFQYKNKLFQIITTRATYALRKAYVEILENKEGGVKVEYKGKELAYSIYDERPFQAEEVTAKELNAKIDSLQKEKYKPTKKHPWKSHYPRTCASTAI